MVFKERKVRNAAVRKSVIFAEAPRIWYGDKVYMLMPIERQTYHSLFCPVCGNIRKVTITGRDGHEYTYPCPERTSEGKERKNTLTLFRYEVRELIVQSITISGPDSLASYPRYRRAEEDGTEAKEKDCPRVSMGEGIFKRGSGNKGIHTVGIYDHPRVFEPDEEHPFGPGQENSFPFSPPPREKGRLEREHMERRRRDRELFHLWIFSI